MKKIFKILLYIFTFLFFLGSLVIAYDVYHLIHQPLLQKHDHVIIKLDKSTSATSFVHLLQSRHFIRSARVFLYLIRLEGLSHQLKAGVYEIKVGESAQQFLYRVVAGDVLHESLTIIEGSNQRQVIEQLVKAPYLTPSEINWPALAAPYANIEGLLLADTYFYDAGSTCQTLITRAKTNLEQYLAFAWQQRATDLPYQNAYELLIAASIIEKETAKPNERRLISGIIVNRLKNHMRLQMDPTVIYALGSKYTGKLTHQDMSIDSPYNTYRYHGLPPTPIAMVGKQAIDAAAHPESTNFIYFVAKGDGTHEFSVTYEQQRAAIMRYTTYKKAK